MKSKDEFVAKWKHDLAGMVLDALVSNATGAELAVKTRLLMEKVETRLAQYWTDLQEPILGPVRR